MWHEVLPAHGASSGAGLDCLSDGALGFCRVAAKVGGEPRLAVCGTKGKQDVWPGVGCTGTRDELPQRGPLGWGLGDPGLAGWVLGDPRLTEHAQGMLLGHCGLSQTSIPSQHPQKASNEGAGSCTYRSRWLHPLLGTWGTVMGWTYSAHRQ